MLYLIFMFSFTWVRSTVASQLSTSLVRSERYFHWAVQSVQNVSCLFSLSWLHKQPVCPSALLKVFWPEVHGNFRLGRKKRSLTLAEILWRDAVFSAYHNLSWTFHFNSKKVKVQYWCNSHHSGCPPGMGTAAWCLLERSEHPSAVAAFLQSLAVCPGSVSGRSPWEWWQQRSWHRCFLLVRAPARRSLQNRFAVLTDTHCQSKWKGWVIWS